MSPLAAGGLLMRRIWSQVTNTYGHEYLHRPDLALLRCVPPGSSQFLMDSVQGCFKLLPPRGHLLVPRCPKFVFT